MLSTKKVAKRLHVAQAHVRKLCRDGKLNGQLIGTAWFVRESSLGEFEAARTLQRVVRAKELSELRKHEGEIFKSAQGMISARKAAKRLGVAQGYIRKLCREGELDGQLIVNAWFVNEASIAEFEAARLRSRTERSEELAELRREENKILRHAQGLPEIKEEAQPISGSFSMFETYPSLKTVTLSVGGILLFSAIAFAGSAEYIQRTSAPALTAALSHIESPFFGLSPITSGAPNSDFNFFSAVLGYLFNTHPLPLAQQTSPPPPTVTSPPPTPPAQTNSPPIVQNNTYPITERTIVHTQSGITQADLDVQLAKLSDTFNQEIYNFIHTPPPVITFPGNTIPPSGSLLTITDADVPDNITASNYLPLAGGTITGTLVLNNALSTASGGTGLTSYNTGDILYASGPNTLATLPIGASGRVLKVSGGLPTWGLDISGSGGSSTWATTTDNLAIIEGDPTQVVIIGASATTTTGNIFEVAGNSLFRNSVTSYGTLTAPRFVATTSVASVFPYASSTALTVSGIGYFGTASTTNLIVSSLASGVLLKTTTAGAVIAATAGSDFENPLTFSAPLSRSVNAISITQSGTGANGYLSSTDFNTFNNKISSTSLVAASVIAYTPATGIITTTGGTFGAGNYIFPGTLTATGGLSTLSNLLLTGSTTLQNFTALLSTTSQATTTSFAISSIGTGNLLKTTTGGAVVAAVAGTDYVAGSSFFAYPFPSNSTSTLLNFNGGLTTTGATSSGTFAVSASTTLASLLNVGGALNANSTLTVLGNTSLQQATSTTFFSTVASSTNLFSTAASFGTLTSGNATHNGTLSVTGLSTLATLLTTGSTTISSLLNATNGLYAASTTLAGNTLLTNATTTALTILGTASTTNLIISSAGGVGTRCAQFATDGTISAAGSACASTSGFLSSYDAWTHPSAGQSATTSSLLITSTTGLLGIGTTSPYANLSIHNLASSTQITLFAIGSTTNAAGVFSTSTLFSVSNIGAVGIATTTPSAFFSLQAANGSGGSNGSAAPTGFALYGGTGGGGTGNSGTGGVGGSGLLITGNGGTETNTSGTAGAGGLLKLISGTGGLANGNSGIGGAGGSFVLTAGDGGVGNGTSGGGGAGGSIQVTAGNAGVGNSGVGAVNGGDIYLVGGLTATGNSAASRAGNVLLGINSSGTAIGNIGVGTTTPWANFAIHANASSTNRILFALASSTNVAGVFSTTTLFSISNTGTASTTGLIVSSGGGVGTRCAQFATDGTISAAGSACATTSGFLSSYDAFTHLVAATPNSATTSTILLTATSSFLGIGTSSPYANLSIHNLASSTQTTLFAIGSTTNAAGVFSTSTLFVVNNIGNVGIGTTSPAFRLETLQGTNGVLPGLNIAEQNTTIRRATIGFGANSAATTGWLMGQGLSNNTTKDFYIFDLTAGATRLYIDTSGNVGVGTTTPWATLAVNPTAGAASNQFVVGSSSATSFIINNSGNVGIGTPDPSLIFGVGVGGAPTNVSRLQVAGTDAAASISLARYTNGSNGPRFVFTKSRGTTVGTFAALQSGDILGQIVFDGSANSTDASSTGALIASVLDGAPSGGPTLPGALTFSVNGITEAMRITSAGNVGIGTTTPTFDGNATNRFFAVSGEPGGVGTVGEIGVGGNITSTTGTLGAFEFYNASLSTVEKRNAAILGGNDGATNSGNLQFWTWSAGVAAEKVRIDKNGNLGIGTTSPSQALSVLGKVYTTGGIQFADGSLQTAAAASAAAGIQGQIAFYNANGSTVSGTSTITITQAGNVGIGTTTPIFDANTSRFFAVSGENLGTNNFGEIGVGGNVTSGTGAAVGSYAFYNASLSTADKRIAAISGVTDGATNSGALTFFTWNAGTAGEKMRIDKSGNVGIGTTSPSQALSVLGKVYTTGGVQFADGSLQTAAAASAASGLQGQVAFYNVTGTTISGTSTLTITQAGNVGIGTTTPAGKLDIEGSQNSAMISNFTNPNNGSGAFTEVNVRNDYTAQGGMRILAMGTGWSTSTIFEPDRGMVLSGNALSNGLAVGTQASAPLVLATNSTERMRIDSSGNVGIGTTSPFTNLGVQNNFGSTNSTLFAISSSTAADGSTANNLFSVSKTGTASTTGLIVSSAGGVGTRCAQFATDGTISANASACGSGSFAYDAFTHPSAGVSATTSNIIISASSTIGDGTQTGGLTISGGATTTGNNFALGFFNTSGTTGGYKIDNQLFATGSTTNSATLVGFGAGSALLASTSAAGNTAFGFNALQNATSSSYNTAIGYQALLGSPTISNTGFNTAVGYKALTANTTGTSNVALGYLALPADTTGSNNIAIGTNALLIQTTASNNIAIGANTLKANVAGNGANVAIGVNALTAQNGAQSNVAVGQSAGLAITSSGNNTALGTNSLTALTNDATGSNVAVGFGSLSATTGHENTSVGAGSLGSQTSSSQNTAVGANAAKGTATFSAKNITAIGYAAASTTGAGSDYGTYVGYQSGVGVTTGYGNTLLGAFDLATGNTTNITTGFGNLGLGYNTFFPSQTGNRQLNIGNLIYGTLPATTTAFTLPTTGALGVGTSSPFAKFSIQVNSGDTNTTLFAIGSSTQSATTTLFNISNTGSTTVSNGVNITAGCFSLNGTCLAIGSSSLNGTTGQVAYFSGTNTAVGTSSLFISTAGNVGIGSTSPWGRLSVDTSSLSAGVPSFVVGSSTRTDFVISQAGNVAIGTTTSGFNTAISDSRFLSIDSTGSTGALTRSVLELSVSRNSLGADDTIGQISFWAGTSTRSQIGAILGSVVNGNSSAQSGYLSLFTMNAGSLAERMRITNNGNVGIGTSTPRGILTLSHATSPNLNLDFTDSTNGAGQIIINEKGVNKALFDYIGSTFSVASLANTVRLGSLSSAPLALYTNSSERIRIDTSGNVGIGTTSPETTLTVVGAICAARAAGVQTTACGTTAGGIFANTSSLSSGSDVAETYKTNDSSISSGDIVAFDTANSQYIAKATSGTTTALGVIATNPALMLGESASTTRYMALAGRVPVKINFDNGPIVIGDRITISTSTPGVGMKSGPWDVSVGVALENYDALATSSTVIVYINPTPGINIPDLARALALSAATSSPQSLLAGAFASASDSLKNALSSALDAVVGIAQSGVRELGLAVHASVGVFDNIFAQTITVDTISAQKLCLGQTCITESQLQVLLNGQSASAAVSVGSASGAGSGSWSEASSTPPLNSGAEASSTLPVDSGTSTPDGIPPPTINNGGSDASSTPPVS